MSDNQVTNEHLLTLLKDLQGGMDQRFDVAEKNQSDMLTKMDNFTGALEDESHERGAADHQIEQRVEVV